MSKIQETHQLNEILCITLVDIGFQMTTLQAGEMAQLLGVLATFL